MKTSDTAANSGSWDGALGDGWASWSPQCVTEDVLTTQSISRGLLRSMPYLAHLFCSNGNTGHFPAVLLMSWYEWHVFWVSDIANLATNGFGRMMEAEPGGNCRKEV